MRRKLALAAVFLPLLLAGCVPMNELRAGPDRERLIEIARQYCAAERSGDPADTAPFFEASMRNDLRQILAAGGGGWFAAAGAGSCEPGRTWYLGGSRTFIDVNRGDRTERLDFWDGAWPLIHDVVYLKPRTMEGRKVKTLRQALMFATQPPPGKVPAPPPLPDRACVPEFYNFPFLETDTQIFRQGGSVKVTPSVNMQPAGTRKLPVGCTSGWDVTGPAKLSADRTTLTIAPDAPVGALVTVMFFHQDKPVKAQFKVIGRDEIVLTGRYSQQSVERCQVTEPIGELEFTPGNRFSVTYRPFESYRDYWGSYSFDPQTGRIAFKPEGGNFVPPGLDLEGEAKLAGGRLVLSGVFLGSRDGTPQENCTYRF